jgi:3-oxoadipate enol-lactonase
MAAFDRTADLAALASLPTLVMSAREDRIALPAFGQELARAIPGARYVEVADAGHAVTLQCAEVVNAALLAHLAGA